MVTLSTLVQKQYYTGSSGVKKTFTFSSGNKNIYLHLMPLLHNYMTQVIEIFNLLYVVNVMDADVLATQGARASATMIYNILNRINLVSATKG